MHKGLLIYLSIFMGLALTVGGGYIVIDNLAQPKGLLFEGIVGAALGIMLLLIILVAKTFGNTIIVFTEILEQTTELNQKIAQASRPTLPSLFSGLIPPGSSITMTDLKTGETQSTPINPGKTGDAIERMNQMIFNAMKNNPNLGSDNKNLEDLSNLELEEKLADAINKDDFEKAAEINAVLKGRKDSGSGSLNDSGESPK